MKTLLCIMLATGLVFSALPCGAEGLEAVGATDNEKASAERQAHIQLMNDRLINKLPQFAMTGELKKLSAERYSINGEVFEVSKDTRIQGRLVPGARAEVRGFIEQGKSKLANQIVVFEETPSAAESSAEEPAAVNSETETQTMKPLPR